MALEIERRFLVQADGWRSHVSRSQPLRQGYLVAGPDGFTVRVRLSELEAWLTLKAAASADGLVRHEFEYPIPLSDAADLLAICPWQLAKTRHHLDLEGGEWVLDAFEGGNAPLLVAEVELDRAGQLITLPAWCGLEITGRQELSNAALARRPLASWSGSEQRALLNP
ncbi:MAG: CYTH domain-containing protein [Cyanobacteriota bacterium]|jgi:adenylate cyclase|nr:CYTH domain-containing protein [Cyanobacteriota bacterium]